MTAAVRVCVFCASGPVPERYELLAADVGRAIASRGWTLVSGGGRLSMMGAVARAARSGGAHTVGVIPQGLVDLEVADASSDELVVTGTMRERKAEMDANADAFVALPGGLGTLEELAEVWTGRTLGMHDKPVVLLDPDGHYGGLLDWVRGIAADGFVRSAALDHLSVAVTVEEALGLCTGRPRAGEPNVGRPRAGQPNAQPSWPAGAVS